MKVVKSSFDFIDGKNDKVSIDFHKIEAYHKENDGINVFVVNGDFEIKDIKTETKVGTNNNFQTKKFLLAYNRFLEQRDLITHLTKEKLELEIEILKISKEALENLENEE